MTALHVPAGEPGNGKRVKPRRHDFVGTAGCVWPMDDGGTCDALLDQHDAPAPQPKGTESEPREEPHVCSSPTCKRKPATVSLPRDLYERTVQAMEGMMRCAIHDDDVCICGSRLRSALDELRKLAPRG